MTFFNSLITEWNWDTFWSAVSGIGTVGAVIVSLVYSHNNNKPKLSFIAYTRNKVINIGVGAKAVSADRELSITPYNPSSVPISIRFEGIRNKPNFKENLELLKKRWDLKEWKHVTTIPLNGKDFFDPNVNFDSIQPHSLSEETCIELKYLNKHIEINLDANRPIQFVYREISGKVFYLTLINNDKKG